MNLSELLHQVIEYGEFGGNIDKEEAAKAIDEAYPKDVEPEQEPDEAGGGDAGTEVHDEGIAPEH